MYKRQGEEFVGGYLTEAVKSKPYALILLDEIEKANPRVLDLFLQILDEGKITDGMGREVIFTNTIIIATSNIASKEIADLISQGRRYSEVIEAIMPTLDVYKRQGIGYDARKEEYVNMLQAGILDPVKVTRLALENAASVASMLLTTEAVVVEEPKKEEPMMGNPGGGMDMM